jgi:glutamyl-tRNA reductase
MNIVAVGINHRTAPLEVREKVWYSDDEIRAAIGELKNTTFSECFLVSTCNRTELYGVPKNGSQVAEDLALIEQLKDFLITFKSASSTVERKHFYHFFSVGAVQHLFKVASGIDSMVIGDVQILSQIKDGYTIALEAKTTNSFTHRLIQATYHVGKRTRTETRIVEGAVSVSYAAVELANKIFSDLSKRAALLIGAGETGELTAKHLVGRGIGKLLVTNRTRSKAEELVASLGGEVVDFDQLTNHLLHADIIISSVTAPQHILTKNDISHAMKERAHRPLFIIDIGVPRNIEPSVNDVENVFLHDMDALSGIVDQNLQMRKAEIPKVNAIILEELTEFHNWHESLQVNPTIADLRNYFETIRQEEVAKNINRFTPENRELLELVTKRIVNKLLHAPTTSLKNGNDESLEDKHTKLHIVRSLFGLSKETRYEEKK